MRHQPKYYDHGISASTVAARGKKCSQPNTEPRELINVLLKRCGMCFMERGFCSVSACAPY